MNRIPIMRPSLPSRAAFASYLDAIDEARSYTNNGPLLRAFESRLAERYGGDDGVVACVANGTAALSLALMAQNAERGGLCILPSFTFAATAHAACLAGLRPYFIDVDAASWTITPAAARDAIARLRADGETVSACIPVAPFGAPIDPEPWSELKNAESVAVVLDAAAGFTTVSLSDVPTAVSLHAVKMPGIGEGGFVLWRDEDGITAVRRLANFGFAGDRVSTVVAMNAKMSEYHAAVGHAVLDSWDDRAARMAHLADLYRSVLGTVSGVTLQNGWGESWRGGTLNVITERPATDLIAALDEHHDIEARQWWATPCHIMPAFAGAPHDTLANTTALARNVLALPFHEDLGAEALARIVLGLRASLDRAPADVEPLQHAV